MPHRTLLLDVPASIGLTRRRGARGKQNRLDRESAAVSPTRPQRISDTCVASPAAHQGGQCQSAGRGRSSGDRGCCVRLVAYESGAGPTHDNMPFQTYHWSPFDYRLAPNCGQPGNVWHMPISFTAKMPSASERPLSASHRRFSASMVQPRTPARCLRNLPLLPSHQRAHASRLLRD